MKGRSRRRFLQGSGALASLGLIAGCGVSPGPWAQPARPRRIGWLLNGSPTSQVPQQEALLQGLRELGYVEGRDVTFERRYSEGREDRLPELAAELVRLDVDVILVGPSAAIRPAGQATTIPIVCVSGGLDPVAAGLVATWRGRAAT